MRASLHTLVLLIAVTAVWSCNRHSVPSDSVATNNKGTEATKIDQYDLAQDSKADSSVVNITPEDRLDSNIFVKFERTPCYGQCPTFEVIVYQNGLATLNGIRFYDLIGKYQYQIPNGMMTEILEAFENAAFFDMAASYPENEPTPTDLPKTKILIQSNGKVKQVVDNKYNTPAPLVELERYLNDLWISLPWEQL